MAVFAFLFEAVGLIVEAIFSSDRRVRFGLLAIVGLMAIAIFIWEP